MYTEEDEIDFDFSGQRCVSYSTVVLDDETDLIPVINPIPVKIVEEWNFNGEADKSIFKCGVCSYLPGPEYLQCVLGHLTCKSCSSFVTCCQFIKDKEDESNSPCGKKMAYFKSPSYDLYLRKSKLSCDYNEQCGWEGEGELLNIHRLECKYRPLVNECNSHTDAPTAGTSSSTFNREESEEDNSSKLQASQLVYEGILNKIKQELELKEQEEQKKVEELEDLIAEINFDELEINFED